MNTEPNGLLGAVMAAEGIGGMKAMINGPGGCRSRTQILVKEFVREYAGEELGCCSSKYYSRQSKLPCTYLNEDDMIHGSANKIEDGLESVLSVSDTNAVLIDTLGASLQVTDEDGIVQRSSFRGRVVSTNRRLSSLSFYEGFDDTVRRIIEHIAPYHKDIVAGSINVLGYNITDIGWEYGRKEISDLLCSVGAEFVSFIGCGCSKEEVLRSGRAELNVVLHPEFAMGTAEYYQKEFGTPYIVPEMGAPIGYNSIIYFLKEVSAEMRTDPEGPIGVVGSEKNTVSRLVMNTDKIANDLRGCGMSITGTPSDIFPITEWMHSYLSLVPEHVKILGDQNSIHARKLKNFLKKIDCLESLNADGEGQYKVIFTDGMTAKNRKATNTGASFVEISMPYSFGTSFINRSLIGTYGCRYILDEIINGYGLFVCGQPTMADLR